MKLKEPAGDLIFRSNEGSGLLFEPGFRPLAGPYLEVWPLVRPTFIGFGV